jgi:hypothetical protein
MTVLERKARSPGLSLPSSAGKGGAERRMGYGPLRQRRSHCTNVTAYLQRSILAFHAPSGASDRLPRFGRKGAALESSHDCP